MGDELTYTANKDGTLAIKDTEGNEVRYVKESDLLAVKGSSQVAKDAAETAAKAATESQETHKVEIATASTNLETTRQKLLEAEAKATTLEETVKAGTGTAEELTKAKADLETAKTSGEELSVKALEYRRQIVVSTFGIPADTIKEKNMEQLDNYEEALKAIISTKGIGNYAIGGGGGGSAPVTALDRAKTTLAAAMEKRAKGFMTDEKQ